MCFGFKKGQGQCRRSNVAFLCFSGANEVISVQSEKYMKHLVEQANLHFIATGKIKETGQIVTAMKVVTLRNPQLTITV